MSKTGKVVLILIFMMIGSTQKVFAQDITDISKLIEGAKEYDKMEFTIRGEAIGEGLERGSYTWINVADSTNAIGVWIPAEDAKKIEYFGDYKHKGDIITVTGLFSRACLEHGGEADFHSTDIHIYKGGYETIEIIDRKKITSLAGLMGGVLILFIMYKKRIRLNSEKMEKMHK